MFTSFSNSLTCCRNSAWTGLLHDRRVLFFIRVAEPISLLTPCNSPGSFKIRHCGWYPREETSVWYWRSQVMAINTDLSQIIHMLDCTYGLWVNQNIDLLSSCPYPASPQLSRTFCIPPQGPSVSVSFSFRNIVLWWLVLCGYSGIHSNLTTVEFICQMHLQVQNSTIQNQIFGDTSAAAETQLKPDSFAGQFMYTNWCYHSSLAGPRNGMITRDLPIIKWVTRPDLPTRCHYLLKSEVELRYRHFSGMTLTIYGNVHWNIIKSTLTPNEWCI